MNRILTDIRAVFSLCLILFAVVAHAQNISGNITDESGVPLPGANVIIEGTSTGVSTDFDGNFQIQAQAGQVLQISFIGYTTENVTVGDQDVINISLQDRKSELKSKCTKRPSLQCRFY